MSFTSSEWHRWDLHLHTASSYDYKYKSKDADDKLYQALVDADVRAAAITDHFKIDPDRIKHLREIASKKEEEDGTPKIIFFPGVELRMNQGGNNNLHVILIFSNEADLRALCEDFNAFKREHAKSAESDETIQWYFNNIADFAKRHDALISIHAGGKSQGLDEELSSTYLFNQAIKTEIVKDIQFLEMGRKRDLDNYAKRVFPDLAKRNIPRKPMIICSDCHDPRDYAPKEALWIKADLTFDGLKQCVYQPMERVYVGDVPPMLDRFRKNPQANIREISVRRIDNPANKQANWFNFQMPLSYGMTAVIGNKGCGKSAFSDIIGFLCKSTSMNDASFLNGNKFRQLPHNYAKDYEASITWADGKSSSLSLAESGVNQSSLMEDAQYLPQQYIESVCNDFGDAFQKEIDRVIFSYVDDTGKGNAENLEQLIELKARALRIQEGNAIEELRKLNARIIRLEDKKTAAYREEISRNLAKQREVLQRHDSSKPTEVPKPESKTADAKYQEELNRINQSIAKKEEERQKATALILQKDIFATEANSLLSQIELLEGQFEKTSEQMDEFVAKWGLNSADCKMSLSSPKNHLRELLTQAARAGKAAQDTFKRFTSEWEDLQNQKNLLIASADREEKQYQKYLADKEEWERKRQAIIGDTNPPLEGTLKFFENEWTYLESGLEQEYQEALAARDELTRQLFRYKMDLLQIHKDIYGPIEDTIRSILEGLDDNQGDKGKKAKNHQGIDIVFQAEISSNPEFEDMALRYIDQRYAGKFGHPKDVAHQKFCELLQKTRYDDADSVLELVHSIGEEASMKNSEDASKKVSDRQGFYDLIHSLSYLNVAFKLKMGERNLDNLSPGERGMTLLIFYLALSKDSKPIIIDQPEDNLDNQSIFSKLVPCISKAKQHRQVVIVTHNPNIAVACDAEQIVYCTMNKENHEIRYECGPIETPKIRNHITDVLEGTMPAFNLRTQKYTMKIHG